MEMTIDEVIYCMKSYLPSDDYTHCTECKYYGCKDNKTCKSSEAHQKAIDTMRKYQKIDKSAMMHEIYMAGVNMAGEYQGCWVRFKEIEKIVDRYLR